MVGIGVVHDLLEQAIAQLAEQDSFQESGFSVGGGLGFGSQLGSRLDNALRRRGDDAALGAGLPQILQVVLRLFFGANLLPHQLTRNAIPDVPDPAPRVVLVQPGYRLSLACHVSTLTGLSRNESFIDTLYLLPLPFSP